MRPPQQLQPLSSVLEISLARELWRSIMDTCALRHFQRTIVNFQRRNSNAHLSSYSRSTTSWRFFLSSKFYLRKTRNMCRSINSRPCGTSITARETCMRGDSRSEMLQNNIGEYDCLTSKFSTDLAAPEGSKKIHITKSRSILKNWPTARNIYHQEKFLMLSCINAHIFLCECCKQ